MNFDLWLKNMGIQKLVVGDQRIETEIQKRKIILGAYLTLMYLGVDLFFFLVNLFNPEGEPIVLFIGFFIAVLSLVLIRKGHINLAILIQLIRANYVAFHFSLIDENPYETVPFIYFIPSSLGALAIFGYQERWKGLVFTLLSFILFMISMFKGNEFSPDKAHFYFISNFLLVFVIGVLILVFYDQLAFESEKKIIQQNKELTKANSELDRFVYSVSHDLRAPLTSILGLVNVYTISKEGKEKDKMVELIQGRVLKLDSFIRDILDYSRNARLALKKEKIHVEDFINSVVEGLRFLDGFERNRIELRVQEGFHVFTDPERLKVILNNLLTNSIRYSDPHKKDPFISIEVQQEKTGWSLCVRDNGVGIKPEFQGKVFEMFYQATQHPEGSGLGLYIVQEAVELLNGRISLTSEYGEGTRIMLYFGD